MPEFVVAAYILFYVYNLFPLFFIQLKDNQVVLFLGCCTEPQNSIQTFVFQLFFFKLCAEEGT